MTDLNRHLLSDFPSFDPKQVWVLLWSQRQGLLHIETLEAMLASHAAAYREDRDLQYIPLLIGDRDVIDMAADVIRPTLAQRYDARPASILPYVQLP